MPRPSSPVAPPVASSPRVDRRRARTRAAILEAATRLLAGGDATLDEIADAADVARATLYTHFDSKGAIVSAICRPVLERATRALAAIRAADARDAVRAVVGTYADLWRDAPGAMRVSHRERALPDEGYAALHAAFMREVQRIFGAAERAGVLRADAVTAARVLRTIAVPLLEACAAAPAPADAFRATLEGALLADRRRPTKPRARRA